MKASGELENEYQKNALNPNYAFKMDEVTAVKAPPSTLDEMFNQLPEDEADEIVEDQAVTE